VVLDTEQSPLLRVSLRTIKDYAKPIEVTANGQTYLFWKWYLATEDIVNELVRKELGIRPVAPKEELVQESKEQSQEEKKDDDKPKGYTLNDLWKDHERSMSRVQRI